MVDFVSVLDSVMAVLLDFFAIDAQDEDTTGFDAVLGLIEFELASPGDVSDCPVEAVTKEAEVGELVLPNFSISC
jgi:hypothetical protein